MNNFSREEVYDIVPQRAVLPQTLEEATAQYHLYTQVCKAILTDDDYAVIRGKKHRTRSGWAKLRRAFNVSIDVLEEDYQTTDDLFFFRFTVRATLPTGRVETSDGLCSSAELAGSNIAPTLHNVRAKALTRAKNRATSDILGAGIVSAEEMLAPPTRSARPAREPRQRRHQATPPTKPPEKEHNQRNGKHWIADPEVRRRFWAWTQSSLGLSADEVHEALDVTSTYDFPGSMNDAREVIESYVANRATTPEEKDERDNETG